MGEGELYAVAKYRVIPNYAADLSTYPANPAELEDVMTAEQNPVRYVDFSYSVSEPIAITNANNNLVPINTPREYTFTFNNEHSIPIGVTDLSLQIVFRGTLGDELNNAIAVGRVDLNEPSHIVYSNSTDQIVVNGELTTAENIRNTPWMAQLADWNNNGIFNEIDIQDGVNVGEPFIDPYDLSLQFGFSQEDPGASEPDYTVSINNLPAGRYSRFTVLTDTGQTDEFWVTTNLSRHYGTEVETERYSLNLGGVYLQENNPVWDYTPLEPDYLHKGIRQNRLLGEYYCLGDPCPYLGGQRTVYENLVPYPIDILP
jgi:hypothetical protein